MTDMPPSKAPTAWTAAQYDALAALRPLLVRFARLQLRDDSMADDVASETLMALIEQPGAFGGRSSLRTYATGVLKHKIVDVFRRGSVEVSWTALASAPSDEAVDPVLEAAGWPTPEPPWPTPEEALQTRELNAALQACVGQLPPSLARAYRQHEAFDRDGRDGRSLGLTNGNAAVLLHRARHRLRECLTRHGVGRVRC